MKRVSLPSLVLVSIQFGTLGFLIFTTHLHALSWYNWGLIGGGLGLGIWATLTMRLSQVSVFPETQEKQQLVTRGPYSLIRHPMYSALLLLATGLLLGYATPLRIVTFLLFMINALIKIYYEELFLKATYPSYEDYQNQTYRVIPWIY